MAEVFVAVRPGVEGFEKTVALKRIRPHLTDEEAFVNMFLYEAKLAAKLHHPNIVQIYDLGRIADSYFIAMEYVSGRDMSKVVPQAERLGIHFPVEYAMFIVANVLEALAYAHEKTDELGRPLKLVHRDVTPENIIVGWNGHVRMLDFGIVKTTFQIDQTKVGEIKGKLCYMSPEQAAGQSIDHRSDLFTLGIVLYEWLTGHKLYTGDSEVAVLKGIMEGRIYPPTYFREDLPTGVEDIVLKALTKDPDARYQSAREMLFDVQNWLQMGADFAPTSSHLANFMKQIFSTEIERERAMLATASHARRAPLLPAEFRDGAPEPGDTIGRAKTPAAGIDPPALILVESEPSSQAPLSVAVSPDDLAKIRRAAARSAATPEDVVADLLRGALKYL